MRQAMQRSKKMWIWRYIQIRLCTYRESVLGRCGRRKINSQLHGRVMSFSLQRHKETAHKRDRRNVWATKKRRRIFFALHPLPPKKKTKTWPANGPSTKFVVVTSLEMEFEGIRELTFHGRTINFCLEWLDDTLISRLKLWKRFQLHFLLVFPLLLRLTWLEGGQNFSYHPCSEDQLSSTKPINIFQ